MEVDQSEDVSSLVSQLLNPATRDHVITTYKRDLPELVSREDRENNCTTNLSNTTPGPPGRRGGGEDI